VTDRPRIRTPTYAEGFAEETPAESVRAGDDLERLAAELEGEDTRPGREDAQERREKRRRELRDSVREMVAVKSPAPHESYGELRARMLELQAERARDAQRLAEIERERDAAIIRAEDAEGKLRALRGVQR